MMLVMKKKITLDVLAEMIQAGFLDMARRMDSLEERLQALTLRVDTLENRFDMFEEYFGAYKKEFFIFKERTENGFYDIVRELRQIRKLIAEADTRKQVHALEIRVDGIEKEIGLKT
jgi:polyhydroxyalkanoate synthesis regulator phasin